MEYYQCVMSIGIRCFTEIFLKKLNLKKFSGPFDAMYSSSILNVIDVFENKINKNDLFYTDNIKNNSEIDYLHKIHGYRTINIKYDKLYFNNIVDYWHKAFLPHHNLNKQEDWEHFERCFKRIEIIKKNKIKTLFCLFFHPKHGTDGEVSFKDIQTVSNYLKENYNCHLLICRFLHINNDYKWHKVISTEDLTYIHINNSSWEFEINKEVLNEIFSFMNVKECNLLKYEDI
tara:strand:+ start:292 stop:984 length:693 start_codon:yes stop_codon:yes gene_type:complete